MDFFALAVPLDKLFPTLIKLLTCYVAYFCLCDAFFKFVAKEKSHLIASQCLIQSVCLRVSNHGKLHVKKGIKHVCFGSDFNSPSFNITSQPFRLF